MDTDRQELAAFVERGDREALGRLLQRHVDSLFNAALRVLNDRAEAQDVAQDACMKAMAAAGTYRGDCSVKSWLLRITFNLALNRKRDRQRSGRRERDAGEQAARARSTVVTDDLREVVPALETAIAGLEPSLQSTVILHYYERMTQTEIAAALGCAQRTVHYRLTKALKSLQAAFQNQGCMAMAPFILPALQQVQVAAAPPALAQGIQAGIASAALSTLPQAVTGALTQTAALGGEAVLKAKTFLLTSVAVASLSFGGGYVAKEMVTSTPLLEDSGEVVELRELAREYESEAARMTLRHETQADEIESLRADSAALLETLAALRSEHEATLAELAQASRTTARSGAAAVPVKKVDAGKGAAGKAKAAFANFARLGDMLNDPAVRKMYETQVRSMIEIVYGDLADSLQLTEEDSAAMHAALFDGAMEMAGDGFRVLSSLDDEASFAEVTATLEQMKRDREDKYLALLGPSKYQDFVRFEERKEARQFVNSFCGKLAQPLPAYEKDRLIDILHEERIAGALAGKYGAENDAYALLSMFEEFGDADFAQRLDDEQAEIDARVATRVRLLLSAEELQAFKECQANFREMMRLSMQTLQGMFDASAEN